MIIYLPRQGQYVNIKISNQNIKESLANVEKVWDELAPGFPFHYRFLDDSFKSLYEKDAQMAKAILLFSLIAILIAFFGILGLTIFLADIRTKEIGIRKVNGATSLEIVILLNKDLIQWIIVAFIIATPIAFFIMKNWLENFAYKTNLSWWIFALSGLSAFLIAILTVSFQSWRAARRNPIEALQYE